MTGLRSALGVVALGCAVLLSGCAGEGPAPGRAAGAPSTSPPRSAGAQPIPSPPPVTDYATDSTETGPLITDLVSARRLLPGTTAEFRTFIATLAAVPAPADCPNPHRVDVVRYRADGWAFGGIGDCGGVDVVWVRSESGWRQIWAGQERLCADRDRLNIPGAIFGHCV